MLQRLTAHYEVLEKLGEGGMGVVYKARDTRLERVIALKVLPAEKVTDLERKRRFVQEAKAASALNHPNIITIYDIDSDQGLDFIAMEYVAGRTLDRLIPRQGMRPAEVLRYAVQIADALSAAHAAGIIHRDLKPGNIMVADSGLVKVLDFGLAKLTEKTVSGDSSATATLGDKPETEEGHILGTIAYMSPEQAQGLKLDGRSDIFTFGAVLYEMLTGHRAFSGDTKVSTLAAILNREPQPLAETTPRELDRIVTRCLRKDPARRFQTMADLKVALQELKEESESGRLSAAAPPARKSRWPLVAAALSLVAIAATGAWFFWKARSAEGPVNRNLRQLTFDAGETVYPSLSPDAKLLAYQSDRAGPGRYDIWVQQTSGGAPLRLTKAPGDHRRPAFSREGSKIYFESTGPPQGIYEVSVLGGEPRLVVADGRIPSVSPDGRSIAYYALPSQELSIISVTGGETRLLAASLGVIGPYQPIWSADSQRVVVFGQKTGQPETREWWAIPSAGGSNEQLSWAHWAGEHHYLGWPDALLSKELALASLASRAGETTQIYRVKFARRGWQILGEPEPLTSGAAWSQNASLAAGKIAFQSGEPETGIWSLPADTNQGRITGALNKLTAEKAVYRSGSLTSDGKTMVFSSNRTGSMDVIVRDMDSGQERTITPDEPDKSKAWALIDTKGTEVVYTMSDAGSSFDAYVVPALGGAKRKICRGCGPTISLTPDGKQFLAFRVDGARSHISIVDVASGKSTLLLQHSKYPVNTASLSPDGKWIALSMTRAIASADVMLAPFRGVNAVPEQDWIPITPEPVNVAQVFWSPDGGLIYYVRNLGGSAYLMARRLDRNHRPSGPPFRVYEFPGRVRPPATGSVPERLSAVPGRIIGALSEQNYNIWMMDLPK
jgi:serine/threonine protein kinase